MFPKDWPHLSNSRTPVATTKVMMSTVQSLQKHLCQSGFSTHPRAPWTKWNHCGLGPGRKSVQIWIIPVCSENENSLLVGEGRECGKSCQVWVNHFWQTCLKSSNDLNISSRIYEEWNGNELLSRDNTITPLGHIHENLRFSALGLTSVARKFLWNSTIFCQAHLW